MTEPLIPYVDEMKFKKLRLIDLMEIELTGESGIDNQIKRVIKSIKGEG